jgi:transposase
MGQASSTITMTVCEVDRINTMQALADRMLRPAQAAVRLGLTVRQVGHTPAEFVPFLTDIVTNRPRGKEIHVIADNLSAHKTKQVEAFLTEHPQLHMHFTPTYSSWLIQVELWFAKIERDVIARGVFTYVPDLKRKLMRYIRKYNEQPKPVKWKYFDPTRRITPDSIVTVHWAYERYGAASASVMRYGRSR